MMLDHATERNDDDTRLSWSLPSVDESPIPEPKSIIVDRASLLADRHDPSSLPTTPKQPTTEPAPERQPSRSPRPSESLVDASSLTPAVLPDQNTLQVPNGSGDALSQLTPLTDVPDEEDDVEEINVPEQPDGKDGVDEGYQSGEPSPDVIQTQGSESSPIEVEAEETSSSKEEIIPNEHTATPKTSPTLAVSAPEKTAESSPATSSKSIPRFGPGIPAPSPVASTSKAPTESPKQRMVNGVRKSATPMTPTKSQTFNLDSKISVLLELNAEMIKIFADFQARNLHNSAECQVYQARLQSNLQWLASVADKSRPEASMLQVPLPNMDTPPIAGLIDGARLKQLYEKLPVIFAKDLALRQRLVTLKRERTPDDVTSISRKRQDMGDGKLGSFGVTPGEPRPMANGIRPPPTHTALGAAPMGAPPMPSGQPGPTPITQMHNPLGNVGISQVSRLAQTNASAVDVRSQMQARQLAQAHPNPQSQHGSPPPPSLRGGSSMPAQGMHGEPPRPTINGIQPGMPPQAPQPGAVMNAPQGPIPGQLSALQALQDPNNPTNRGRAARETAAHAAGNRAVQRNAA